ncbi:4-hydroxy-2-oxo-heptane-1,7-dioate aldolase [Rhodovastum atsumiense]|uniref:HpcH/HpaI aldolase/citrate lyase family protein n=1 Tax=Rhodovastum atsumiense TaxID=504468 RepID=A0A5M6IYP0_9PROT|nr:HpcH/HpaI aldolase/citrate lyase family protein [Rhodovastum atsumiense]KAA5613432.1 HpcH/HpaI aldolase/citrate lyase family protein [Rhodovastum atsumiense]CAH2603162.1 4-hydroxy-2-oxo-heptane-1,7-dioate aldolase [Rhodovastum atsumiense]
MNPFKRDLGRRQQLGLFSTLASTELVELFSGCGFDWILIDTEHSPNELPNVISQLRALNGTGVSPIVRPAWSDMVLVKRVLDAGARSLLFPYVQSAEEAALAVSYTRYPPQGVRGVSGASRAARYGLDTGYLRGAADDICVLVQIENEAGLRNLEAIAAVEGVDGVFIGPSDLAASLGHLGNAQHPEVQAAIDDAFRRLRAVGKPCGYLTTNEAEAARRVAEGVDFIAVATDTSIITRAASALTQRMRQG